MPSIKPRSSCIDEKLSLDVGIATLEAAARREHSHHVASISPAEIGEAATKPATTASWRVIEAISRSLNVAWMRNSRGECAEYVDSADEAATMMPRPRGRRRPREDIGGEVLRPAMTAAACRSRNDLKARERPPKRVSHAPDVVLVVDGRRVAHHAGPVRGLKPRRVASTSWLHLARPGIHQRRVNRRRRSGLRQISGYNRAPEGSAGAKRSRRLKRGPATGGSSGDPPPPSKAENAHEASTDVDDRRQRHQAV